MCNPSFNVSIYVYTSRGVPAKCVSQLENIQDQVINKLAFSYLCVL